MTSGVAGFGQLRVLEPDREGGIEPPSRARSSQLRGYAEVELVEGRGDNVRGLNFRRSLDKSRHHLQHLRIGIGVVSFGIGFVFPQTDCSHINSTGSSECNFVLET